MLYDACITFQKKNKQTNKQNKKTKQKKKELIILTQNMLNFSLDAVLP